MPDETPPRAADAQPAPEEPATNSDDAQEAVDVYKAGVANLNAGDADVVTAEPAEGDPEAPAAPAAPAPPAPGAPASAPDAEKPAE